MKKSAFFILLVFCSAKLMFAQKKNTEKHVVWRTYFEPSKTNLDEGFIVFEARIDSGYQMFARHQMPQLPLGVDFIIKPNADFSLSGDIISPTPTIAYNHAYETPVAVYKGTVEFRQKIKIKSQKEFDVQATVENEEASMTEEVCYQKDVLTINVKPRKGVKLKFL